MEAAESGGRLAVWPVRPKSPVSKRTIGANSRVKVQKTWNMMPERRDGNSVATLDLLRKFPLFSFPSPPKLLGFGPCSPHGDCIYLS